MNDTSAPTQGDIPGTAPRRSKRKLALAIIAILGVGLGLFLIVRPTAVVPNVTILPNGLPSARRSFGILSRLPPSAQHFGYRVKQGLFGSPEQINLNASILHFELPAQTICSKLSLGKADLAGTNGLQVWILATNDLQKAYLHAASLSEIRQLSSPRISTAHGIRASLSVTHMLAINGRQTPIGLTLDCLPYVRKKSIDLTTLVTVTEAITNTIRDGLSSTNAAISVQTNCFIALRMQIPSGAGAFILQESAEGSSGKGVFISFSLPRTKR